MVDIVAPEGVPEVLWVNKDAFRWEKPVDQTMVASEGLAMYRHRTYSADRYGNNFGVGDVVAVHNPNWYVDETGDLQPIEGTVSELHQYAQFDPERKRMYTYPERIFGARVEVDQEGLLPFSVFLPSQRLEAVTNTHVVFEKVPKIPEMTDTPFRDLDQISKKLKSILEDPVARAIWIGYNRSHLMTKGEQRELKQESVRLAKAIRKQDIPRERLAIWFKKNMRFRVPEELAVFMVPYLTGEKEATYVAA